MEVRILKKRKSKNPNSKWLEWNQQLMALSQNGLTYSENQFERERYLNIRRIAEEMLECLSDLNTKRIKNIYEDEKGYATPKVDVRGVVFRKNKILLVKERADGKWTLPGGWADVGDSPSEAVEREILEESGYKAKAVKLIALYDRNKHPHTPFIFHLYKIFFLCELKGGRAKKSLETDGAKFFPEDDLPELSVARVTYQQIKKFFEYLRNPNLPTDFD